MSRNGKAGEIKQGLVVISDPKEPIDVGGQPPASYKAAILQGHDSVPRGVPGDRHDVMIQAEQRGAKTDPVSEHDQRRPQSSTGYPANAFRLRSIAETVSIRRSSRVRKRHLPRKTSRPVRR